MKTIEMTRLSISFDYEFNLLVCGVNIEVMYSDHYNQFILVVDDLEKGKAVSEQWKKL